jgi:hypothetical protein
MTALAWILCSVGGLAAVTGVLCLVDWLQTRRAPRPLDPGVAMYLHRPQLTEQRHLEEGGFDETPVSR